jgi:cell division transport system ATP-binding protein
MSMAKAENGPPHLAFDRVEVYYSALVAGLKGVSLSIERGEFVFLCGQTGSGKSTLLKLITREVRETKGQVSLLGRDLGQLPDREIPYLRRQMGIVPQDYGLLPNKKVWEMPCAP